MLLLLLRYLMVTSTHSRVVLSLLSIFHFFESQSVLVTPAPDITECRSLIELRLPVRGNLRLH